MTPGAGGRRSTRRGWSTRLRARLARAGSARHGTRRSGRRGRRCERPTRMAKHPAATLVVLCVAGVSLVFIALSNVPVVVSQEQPAVKHSLNPRFQPLIGTWEGRVPSAGREERQEHVLVISENAGQLEARHGHPGGRLRRVDLSVDLVESLVRVRFRTHAGHNVTLNLIRDDWLSGVIVKSAGRGPGTPERKIQLE